MYGGKNNTLKDITNFCVTILALWMGALSITNKYWFLVNLSVINSNYYPSSGVNILGTIGYASWPFCNFKLWVKLLIKPRKSSDFILLLNN